MGVAGQHARQRGQRGQRWWHRPDVRYWYGLGIAFLLVGVAQIGVAVDRSSGFGYVIVGVVYLLISAAWLAVGGYKHRREQPEAMRD
jgi:hypothetical protein